jgi:sugar lactone lactonase YvrE
VLLILLALLVAYFMYYRSTRQLGFDIAPVGDELIEPPQYLFSFADAGGTRIQRPIGVLVSGDEVFVVDAVRNSIDVFDLDGEYIRSFGNNETVVPLYIAQNPLDDNIYVSDRRARTIHIFTPEGEYVGEFDPNLPEDQLPTFETQGYQWAPLALAFGEDGTFYVIDILKGHRLLVFSPEGEFLKSTGTAGTATLAEEFPELFLFPNGMIVHNDMVYVTDSNNRRVKVYDAEGEFDRIIVTEGLPRGIDFLAPFPTDEEDTPDRFVVVDTLAHDGTIWSDDGVKILSFGERGLLEAQFSYPNGISIDTDTNKMYISDSANGRMQVWGWPDQISPVPIADVIPYWRWCFAPLLLLPLLLLLRKKRFHATKDFVDVMLEAEDVDTMPKRRRRWIATESDYELIKDYVQDDINLGELFHPMEYSDSDMRSIMDKLEVDEETAIILAIAQRAHVFCTEDIDLRRFAKTLEIEVVDREEFLEKYASNKRKDKEAEKES